MELLHWTSARGTLRPIPEQHRGGHHTSTLHRAPSRSRGYPMFWICFPMLASNVPCPGWFYNSHVTCSLLPIWQDDSPDPVWSPSARTHHSPLRKALWLLPHLCTNHLWLSLEKPLQPQLRVKRPHLLWQAQLSWIISAEVMVG